MGRDAGAENKSGVAISFLSSISGIYAYSPRRGRMDLGLQLAVLGKVRVREDGFRVFRINKKPFLEGRVSVL